jgi:hypothetical protein
MRTLKVFEPDQNYDMSQPLCWTVMESPYTHASAEQMSILYARYDLARRCASGRNVLEVACGAGVGWSRECIGVQYTAGSPESLAECIRKIAEDVNGSAGMRWRAKDLFDAEYHSGRIYSPFANYPELIAPVAMGPGLPVPAYADPVGR